jgi:hypothetical protein
MKTSELQTLWWDWLSTSERLLRSLHEQTAALTLRDVARVERIQPELDQLTVKMREIDESAAASIAKLAEDLGCEPHLRGLVPVLEKAEAQQLQSIANRVMVAARHVESVFEKNRKLIANEMEYIHGTVALVAKAAQKPATKYAPVRNDTSILLNQAA